jgi:hypothetical protein
MVATPDPVVLTRHETIGADGAHWMRSSAPTAATRPPRDDTRASEADWISPARAWGSGSALARASNLCPSFAPSASSTATAVSDLPQRDSGVRVQPCRTCGCRDSSNSGAQSVAAALLVLRCGSRTPRARREPRRPSAALRVCANHAKPTAVIRAPVRLDGRRHHANSPVPTNDQPTSRSTAATSPRSSSWLESSTNPRQARPKTKPASASAISARLRPGGGAEAGDALPIPGLSRRSGGPGAGGPETQRLRRRPPPMAPSSPPGRHRRRPPRPSNTDAAPTR